VERHFSPAAIAAGYEAVYQSVGADENRPESVTKPAARARSELEDRVVAHRTWHNPEAEQSSVER
jgi:hypothetical protein